jgi:lipoyl(octanoyl) transferase
MGASPILHEPAVTDHRLQVYLLGAVDFEVALALQRRLLYQVSGERRQAVLLLCEHPPLLTMGRQGSRSHILFDQEDLRARRWPVRWVNRGGGCWLHGPGQLVIYPILSLDRLELGLEEYLRRLHAVFAAVLDDFGVTATSGGQQPGLWVGGRPLALTGVAVRDWVTYYGGILNIHPDLEPFRRVRCGGARAEPMTSIARERRGPLRPALVRERLLEHFCTQFGFAEPALFFDHPSLPRISPAASVVATR